MYIQGAGILNLTFTSHCYPAKRTVFASQNKFHQALINVAAKAKDLGLPGGRFPFLGVENGVFSAFFGPPITVEGPKKSTG